MSSPTSLELSAAALAVLTAAQDKIRAANLGFAPPLDALASLIIASANPDKIGEEFATLFLPISQAAPPDDPPLDAERIPTSLPVPRPAAA